MSLLSFLALLIGLAFSSFLAMLCTRGFTSPTTRILVFVLAFIPGFFASAFLAIAASPELGRSLVALFFAALCWSPVVFLAHWRKKNSALKPQAPNTRSAASTTTSGNKSPELGVFETIKNLSPEAAAPSNNSPKLGYLPELQPAIESVAPIRPDQFHLLTDSHTVARSAQSGILNVVPASNTQNAVPSSGCLPATFRFSYRDRGGDAEIRTVDVRNISQNGGFTYLEGHCHTRNADRTFRTDRIRGSLTDMDSGEVVPVKRLLSTVRERRAMAYQPSAATSQSATKEWQTAVLFTGFTSARREELEELAAAAGWSMRTSVGPTLDYLVIGPRAGPSKVAKAEELGVSVIDEELFRTLAN